MSNIAAAVLPDGRIQEWRIAAPGVLQTRWKQTTAPNSPWTPFDFFSPAPPAAIGDVAAGPLSDGRLQLWVIDISNVLLTSWKQTTASNSPWTGWTNFIPVPQPLFVPLEAAAAPLPDKRLQLFIMDTARATWTAWKTTTDSTSAWTAFFTP